MSRALSERLVMAVRLLAESVDANLAQAPIFPHEPGDELEDEHGSCTANER